MMSKPLQISTLGAFLVIVFVPMVLFSFSCPGGRCGLPHRASPQVPATGSVSSESSLPPSNFRSEPAPPHPAVVRILVVNAQTRNYGTGTLVQLSEGRSAILTCAHLFETNTPERIAVKFPNQQSFSAQIQAIDRSWDVALLQAASGTSLESVLQGASQNSHRESLRTEVPQPVFLTRQPPAPGEFLRVCGYGPDGQSIWILGATRGYARLTQNAGAFTLVMCGNARSGDSGAPIFTLDGTLAGVLWGTDGQSLYGTWSGQIQKIFPSAFHAFRTKSDLTDGSNGSADGLDGSASGSNGSADGSNGPADGSNGPVDGFVLSGGGAGRHWIPRREVPSKRWFPGRKNSENAGQKPVSEPDSDSEEEPASGSAQGSERGMNAAESERKSGFPGRLILPNRRRAATEMPSCWFTGLWPSHFPFGMLFSYLFAWLIPVCAVLLFLRRFRSTKK